MKLETVRRDVATAGMMQVSQAKIKATSKLFDMFANDTYADKAQAILRELVANGIDAHIMADRKDRPVEVILPTELEPTCTIRDFGTGMHHDFVMGPFMEYTNGSTKDQDDTQIGGFGIGSKSPLSYVDAFTLRVVHDGILSVYTLFKDESGIPAIGLQGQTTTDEHPGVEVSFPVQAEDVASFHEAAQRALQFFRPLPLVTNGKVTPPEYTFVGTEWAMRKSHGPLGVILGGVRYPVTTASLSYDLRTDERLKPLLEYGLDLTLPIGACGIAMSREQLSYVPKTSANIKVALEKVIDDVIQTFATIFDGCATEWDAMKMLADETGLDSYNRSARAQLMMANARYQGQKLETSFRILDTAWKGARAAQIMRRSNRRGVNTPPIKWGAPSDLYSITPGRVECVIIDDLPQTPKSKTLAKIREYLDQQSQTKDILIFRGVDEKEAPAIIDALKNPTDYVLTSTLPEPAVVTKVKSVRPRVRMFTFNGAKDRYTHATITNLTPASSKSEAVKEIAYADQPSGGKIMVTMNSFDLPGRFDQMMRTDLISYDDLIFVNQADAPKIKDNFEDFDKVWNERLTKALAAYPALPQRLAVAYNSTMSSLDTDFRYLHQHGFTLNTAQGRRPFGKLYQLFTEYVAPLNQDQRKLASFVSAALPKGVDPAKIHNDMKNHQPEVSLILDKLDLSVETARQILAKLI